MKKVLYIFSVVIFATLVAVLFTYLPAVRVTINVDQTMAVMPSAGIGVSTAVYENSLADPASAVIAASQLKAAGVTVLRFPGGSYADLYNWAANAPQPGFPAYVPAQNTFENFMNRLVSPAGATAMVTVNYGSDRNGTNGFGGDPNEAASWVRFANITNHWGVKYWEIGNEVAGNGFYGARWEADMHKDKSPMAYGSNVVLFAKAMKRVDPSIKIGVGIAEPGVWPDDQKFPYNQSVLTNCANDVDFVILHWYPKGNGSVLLSQPAQIPTVVKNVRRHLDSYIGARARQIGIAITETAAGANNGPMVSLFCADDYLTWIENGILNVDWHELHQRVPASDVILLELPSSPYTNQQPTGVYYGVQMAHLLADVGDTMLEAISSRGKLRAHAALRRDGRMGVMLINEYRYFSQNVHVTINGASLATSGIGYQFGLANFVGADPMPVHPVVSNSISGLGNSFSVTVPAYTMIDLLIPMVTNTPAQKSGKGPPNSK